MSYSCQETAFVTGLSPNGRAIVKVRRAEACQTCSSKGACTALGGKTQDMVLVVDNTIGAKPGDSVILTLSEANFVKASAVLYLVPALGLIGGALAGSSFSVELGLKSDPASILGSLAGLGLGLLITKLLSGKMSKNPKYIPRLTSIVGENALDDA
jgi:sigma-E factor negative regulatory protein RseC